MHLSRLSVRGLRASADAEIEVSFPGRFSVIIGANSAGKTTLTDALYLGHMNCFPNLPRPSAAGLGSGTRSVDITYTFDSISDHEGPLGRELQDLAGTPTPGGQATAWSRVFSRNLGRIRVSNLGDAEMADRFRLVYLPAWRNPIDELARREARVLIELLRAQQQRINGSRNLTSLRVRAASLLENLAKDGIIAEVEGRIKDHLLALSSGVSRHWPYVRGQTVDDTYLARVLEFMLAALEGREHAHPLEVSGLGYVNLLHIAVTLAAIPDAQEEGAPPREQLDTETTTLQGESGVDTEGESLEHARQRLIQSRAEAESEEDSFFPMSAFHVTVVIEEPEAHLHPQLQHSLARYLRKCVSDRPELQIILSTHATDIVTSCKPEELVVMRKLSNGRRVARTVADIPMLEKAVVLRMARLHMDASRSSALFAERLVLVEGVTDAAILRELGWTWAGDDDDKQSFVNALSIVPMGTRVGAWPVRLLATRGHELCTRLAILSDSDIETDDEPSNPDWLREHDSDTVRIFFSHPTLEPSITSGNEVHVRAALQAVGMEIPSQIDAQSIHEIFRGARKAKAGEAAKKAGPGAKRKGEYALALAAEIAVARMNGRPVSVPSHISQLLQFLYPHASNGTEPIVAEAVELGGSGSVPVVTG